MNKPKMRIIRQIRVPTPRVVGIVTEDVEVTRANLSYGNINFEVGQELFPQKMVNLYKQAGIDIEYFGVMRPRGMTSLAGTKVNVVPINRQSYESGALIRVFEKDNLTSVNTNKVLRMLNNNGIDWDTECELWEGEKCLLKTSISA